MTTHIIENENGDYLLDAVKPRWIEDHNRATQYPDLRTASDRLDTLFETGLLDQDGMDAAAIPLNL